MRWDPSPFTFNTVQSRATARANHILFLISSVCGLNDDAEVNTHPHTHIHVR